VNIELRHCNNIEHGIVAIQEGALNIKYAINGTGKTTLAKAISCAAAGNPDSSRLLADLIPFKYRAAGGTVTPSVTGIDAIGPIKIFDESYINAFVFQQDDLLKGSFEIFIRTEKYDQGLEEIEDLIKEVKTALTSDPEIERLIADFEEISGSFGKPTKAGIHGSSNLAKALKDGNKVENIPIGLEGYASYIRHESGYKWIKWQQDGSTYLNVGEDCPYCTSDIKEKRETIERVSAVYDPKSIESLNRIVATFERLDKYFSDSTKEQIAKFVRNVEKYSDDQVAFLNEVKGQIDILCLKLKRCRSLGFVSLKDVGKVIEELAEYKVDLSLYNHLQAKETVAKVAIVNSGIESLLTKAGLLQGAVARQRTLVEKLVRNYSEQINEFLKNAGYSYKVVLQEDAEAKHKLRLIHVDSSEGALVNVRNHLSFGERNAIALVLFMFDAIKSAAGLIVLDDPISSFDKNKKYAIIDMLFRRELSLRGKTVLMLTHDLDPVVDMLIHHSDRFEKPIVAFLDNANGLLTEKPVVRADIKTFITVHRENIALPIPTLNKLVYLRRLLEVTNEKGVAFDILSNVFHKREVPTKPDSGAVREMTAAEIADGCASVLTEIPEFDYSTIVTMVRDNHQMIALYAASSSNYEKLHLYRLIFDDSEHGVQSSVVLKFINEAFHIENNYIYQLNPRDYQLVPQFVIAECDRYVAAIA
jgi:energy-coupling factor transporter ATP-binding protein EcfA2